MRPRYIFSSPSASLSLPLSSSLAPFLFFIFALGREIKMSAGGTGQAVCLHLIIIVSHSPTGGHAALIADEKSHMNVLAHMNNIKLHMGNPNHVFNLLPFSLSTFSLSFSHWLAHCFSFRGLLCLEAQSEFSAGLD